MSAQHLWDAYSTYHPEGCHVIKHGWEILIKDGGLVRWENQHINEHFPAAFMTMEGIDSIAGRSSVRNRGGFFFYSLQPNRTQVYKNVQNHVRTYIHYITLHYSPLHCVALHRATLYTLHYFTLHCIALHYITLHTDIHTYIQNHTDMYIENMFPIPIVHDLAIESTSEHAYL